MGLTCECEYDPYPGSICWEWPNNYSTLKTKRARKCASCQSRIEVGDLVAAFYRHKVPEYDIEIAIYGEDECQGPPRATWYHGEECADLMFSISALGFCIDIEDDMRALVKEYAATYGHAQ